MKVMSVIKTLVRVAFTPRKPPLDLQQAKDKLKLALEDGERRLAAQERKLKQLGTHN
jgi:hypothetical protein